MTLHQQRVHYAKERIRRVLRSRIVAYRRELERQVCEVGFDYRNAPPQHRTEPHHFSEAITELIKEEAIEPHAATIAKTQYQFWARKGVKAATVATVLRRKVDALTVFQWVEHSPPLSGWHAERVHHRALVEADDWISSGWQPGVQLTMLGAHYLTRPGDIDLAGHHRRTKTPFVVQIKNGREWFYPSQPPIWDLLGVAAQLHAVPVLIGRRLPDSDFAFMKTVGGFAFRSIKMILPPELETAEPIPGLPTFAQALRELGFHTDVDYIDEPLPRHRRLWTGSFGDEIELIHQRFLEVRDDVLEIAYEEGLRTKRIHGKVSREHRRDITNNFLTETRQRHREEALERYQAEHGSMEGYDEDRFEDY